MASTASPPPQVHTYCAEVTRLTEASFAEPDHPVDEDGTGRPWGMTDDTSHSASVSRASARVPAQMPWLAVAWRLRGCAAQCLPWGS